MVKKNISQCMRIIYRLAGAFARRIKIGPNKYKQTGMLFEVFKIFAAHYNMCYNLTYHNTSIPYGNLDPVNKTFVGSLGSLQMKEQDMMLVALYGNEERYKYFDFSSYIFISKTGALMAYPKVKPNYAAFIQIFDNTNWIAIGCVLFVGFITNAFLNIVRNQVLNNKNWEAGNFGATFGDGFITMLGTFIGQGMIKKRTKHLPSDLFLCIWLVSTLFLNFFYKNNLLSVLVIPKVKIPFRNIYEMVEQDEVKWNLFGGTSFYKTLEGAPPDSTFGKIFSKSIATVYAIETPENLKNVREGKLTLLFTNILMPHTIASVMGQDNVCTYTSMKEPFWSIPSYIMFRKGYNSTIQKFFSNTIIRLRESGILDYITMKDIRPTVFKCISGAGKSHGSLRNLEIEDFFYIFFILLIGYLTATITFLLEYVKWKFKGKKQIQTSLTEDTENNLSVVVEDIYK